MGIQDNNRYGTLSDSNEDEVMYSTIDGVKPSSSSIYNGTSENNFKLLNQQYQASVEAVSHPVQQV
jgi:hypothetical protein